AEVQRLFTAHRFANWERHVAAAERPFVLWKSKFEFGPKIQRISARRQPSFQALTTICNSSLRQSDGPRHEPIKAFGYYLGYQSSKRISIPEPSSAFCNTLRSEPR